MRFILLFVVVAAACVDTPPLAETFVEQSKVAVWHFPESPRAQTDLLIFVDDTQAMEPYRDRLATLPYQFADRMAWYTQRWIDLRVAVVTNDGRLRRLPGTSTPWLTETYDFDYTRRTNYTGTLGDNLAALMNVGTANDGPNQPLDAARRALESSSQFVRERAGLMILTISASDDASPLPVEDYRAWFWRVVDGEWQRDYLLSGIYPAGSPRFDEYYKVLPRSIVTSIDDGYYTQALPWFPGYPGEVRACIDDIDLDPTTQEVEHECAMLVNVNSEWRTLPECTPNEKIERIDTAVSASPSPACWWLRPSVWECGKGEPGYTLELSGYTRMQHPELRFDCRTK